MGLNTFFLKSIESSNRGSDETILTHYYNNSYDQAKNAIMSICKENNFEVINVDDRYHEIFCQFDKGDMIFTLMPVGTKICLDIKINTYYVIAANRTYKLCGELYDRLNSKLNLSKIGGTHGN